MKAQLMRITVGVAALGSLLYFLACTPPAPNNSSSPNQNLSPNQNQAVANKAPLDLSACDDYGSGHGAHAKKIKDEVEGKMSISLKKQLKDQANPKGTFTFEVEKAQNGKYYVGYVKGRISGDDVLKELSNILNDFQGKQDCLRVVFFLPAQTAAAADDGPGFEWSSCQYPMVMCPNGECCQALDPNANSNTNTGNTNTNANTNANRP